MSLSFSELRRWNSFTEYEQIRAAVAGVPADPWSWTADTTLVFPVMPRPTRDRALPPDCSRCDLPRSEYEGHNCPGNNWMWTRWNR